MNFFDHKDLGNHLLQLSPKVVKHPVYICAFFSLDDKPQFCLKTCSVLFCSIRRSVRPQMSFRLPLDRFVSDLMWKAFTKICRENSRFILKWDRNMGHFTGRPDYGSTKCFFDSQQCNCHVSLAAVLY